MLVMVKGFYRAGADPRASDIGATLNEELMYDRIRLAGQLRGGGGVEGFAMVLSINRFEEAETYVRESRFFSSDLFSDISVLEFRLEVGRIE